MSRVHFSGDGVVALAKAAGILWCLALWCIAMSVPDRLKFTSRHEA